MSEGEPGTRSTRARTRAALVAAAALVLLVVSACVPVFSSGSSLTARAVAGSATRANLVWSIPTVDASDSLSYYLISVNGTQAATVLDPAGGPASNCTLTGLTPATTYALRVTAVSASGQASSSLGGPLASAGHVDTTFTTPAGAAGSESLGCVDPVNGATDTDGDGLPNWAETNTKVFNSPGNTGTDPNMPTPTATASRTATRCSAPTPVCTCPAWAPARCTRTSSSSTTGSTTSAALRRATATGRRAPRSPGWSPPSPTPRCPTPTAQTGITMIVDYGQGGIFTGGNLIADADRDLPRRCQLQPVGVQRGQGSQLRGQPPGVLPLRADAASYGTNTQLRPGRAARQRPHRRPADLLRDHVERLEPRRQVGDTIMHELGHNLGLHHGGNVDTNYKPNYNSVMNYLFQFAGVDTDCNASGDHKLDYSTGGRPTLVESALNEFNGVCGPGTVGLDWNGDVIGETSVAVDINGDGLLGTLTDFNDWSHLSFAGLQQADGRSATSPWIAERPARPTP